ncbi:MULTISPECIES: hypothetical protein [Halorhodospira]|uniref:hypothetical protein n=1 Tax=Halorhodospira TaxID=85108 RepID=UPI001EE78D4B|nr:MULTISPECIES: hypothetical protein [Halorhodospira]MCG5526840.1 hypothetical protein [Halorhodospira halophila]MCG5542823.1 hypothetical protein [Halorhodospira sp. 9628]
MHHRTRFFRGSWPRRSARLLEAGQAQAARNCDLDSGALRPLREPEPVEPVDLDGHTVGTIYRWRVGGEDYWLRFPGRVDVAPGPLNDDVWQRIYFAGDPRYDEPRYTYTPAAYQGGERYPVTSYRLGVPAPSNELGVSAVEPPTVAIAQIHREWPIRVVTDGEHGLEDGEVVRFDIEAQSPDEEGGENHLAEYLNHLDGFQIRVVDETTFTLNNTDAENVAYSAFVSGTFRPFYPEQWQEVRFYTHTLVTELGEEGPPTSDPVQITVGVTQAVEIELPPLSVDEGAGRLIQRRRIYRTASGNRGAAFRFVAEVELSDQSFTDTVRSTVLGTALESTAWDPPPKGLRGFDTHPGGFMLGFTDNRLYASEPYRPHAWPELYSLSLDESITALGVFDVSIAVVTAGRPYLVTGSDPRALQARRLEVNESCASPASMVSFGYACVYASPAGLVQISTRGAELLTHQHITEREWAAYKPETIRAFEWGGRYVGFYDGGGFIFDPRQPELGFIDLDLEAIAGHRDPLDDGLYLLDPEGMIQRWDSADARMPMHYRSPQFPVPLPANAGAAQVIAASYENTTFRLFADGKPVHEHTVTNPDPFPLPGGYLARSFEWEVTGTDTVDEVAFGDSMEALVQ